MQTRPTLVLSPRTASRIVASESSLHAEACPSCYSLNVRDGARKGCRDCVRDWNRVRDAMVAGRVGFATSRAVDLEAATAASSYLDSLSRDEKGKRKATLPARTMGNNPNSVKRGSYRLPGRETRPGKRLVKVSYREPDAVANGLGRYSRKPLDGS